MTNFGIENDLILNQLKSENIQANVIILDGNISHPINFLDKKGEVWVKNTSPTTLYYTDNTNTDYPIAGSGVSLVGYTGITDTALGIGAGNENSISGNNNTAIGANSLENITTGSDNTAVGYDSLKSLTTGSQNVAIGSKAMISAGSNVQNTVAIGYQTLALTDTSNSVAIGNNALNGQTGLAQNNTAIGYGSLSALNTGSLNTAVGYNSGISTTSTTSSVSIGYNANCSGNNSMCIGANSISSGANSSVVGYGATDEGMNACIILGKNARGFASNTMSIGSVSNPINIATGGTGSVAGYLKTYLNGNSTTPAYIAYFNAPV